MVEYEALKNDVRSILSKKRFQHCENVVNRAIEYAKIYNVDIEKVKLVAIAHDIAKELSARENEYYIEKYKIELDDVEKINRSLVHSKIGAAICKEKYGFSEDMVDAIKYHTTGRANMSLLEKIIYLADATEEGRPYDIKRQVELIKRNIDRGLIELVKSSIFFVLSKNKIVHPMSVECYNFYVKEELYKQ